MAGAPSPRRKTPTSTELRCVQVTPRMDAAAGALRRPCSDAVPLLARPDASPETRTGAVMPR